MLDLPRPLHLGVRIGLTVQSGQQLTQHERLLLGGESESLVEYTSGTARHRGTIVPTPSHVEVGELRPPGTRPGGVPPRDQPNVTFISFTMGSSP